MLKLNKKRIHEMIPATITWTILLASLALSFVRPIWVIGFIIAFYLMWLFRILHFVILVNAAWRAHRHEIKMDWLEKVKKIAGWEKIYHYILFPTYMESLEVLEDTLKSVLKSDYPMNKLIVHVAGEERAKEHFLPIMETLKQKYSDKFFKLIFTLHPDGVAGEIKGKGANAHYAGLEAQKLIDQWGISYENVICSYFDSDTCVHPKYFANLAYKYLTTWRIRRTMHISRPWCTIIISGTRRPLRASPPLARCFG